MKFNDQLKLLVKNDLKKGLIPMLLGEPGIGKSSWLIDLGRELNTKVFVLPCNQLADKADLTGSRLVPDNNGSYETRFYPHTVINQAITYAKAHPDETPILFLDELNRTTPDVTSEALSIPTLRSIGDVPLPDNLRVVTAGNDKGNITSLDTASITRFVLYHVVPDTQTFLNLDPHMHPCIKSVLTNHPETILCKSVKTCAADTKDDDDDDDTASVDINEILDDGEMMQQMATPRTIMGLNHWLNSFTDDELRSLLADTYLEDGQETSTLQEALEGHTGKTAFTSYLIAELAGALMSGNNINASVTIQKPAQYDVLHTLNSSQDLETHIKTLTEDDRAACLAYALYDTRDNTHVIQALVDNLQTLPPEVNKTIMTLFINEKADESNFKYFMSTGSPLTYNFSAFM